MKLSFEDLPKPYYVNDFGDAEYAPEQYYTELEIQMDEYFQSVVHEQFNNQLTIQGRRHLLQYMKLRKWNELYKTCHEKLYD